MPDELEVKSSVSGTIASINASAGKSIGGEEQPLATINVTDRGFTVKIDVTNDQAKKVKTGDTAELVNFWGGDARRHARPGHKLPDRGQSHPRLHPHRRYPGRTERDALHRAEERKL